MSHVAFQNPVVSLSGNQLRIDSEIVNVSGDTWSAENGWAAGYHLFDTPSGTLVVDGERTPLALVPQASQHFGMSVTTPPEPGDYSIYISAMREHVAWFYEQGWPFLKIDIQVGDDGTAQLRRWGVTDRRVVLLQHAGRSFLRAFTLPFEAISKHRNLIRTLVRRDVMSRYTGSFGGAFWAVLNPLMLMLTYFFVFGIVMDTKFGDDPSHTTFALYFLAGMMPWLAFSEAIGRAPFVMLDYRNFVKKLVFPVETLPINVVVSGLVTEFFGLILFLLALLLIRGYIPLSVVYLPLVIIPQILFTAGLAWFLAALGVFMRDLGQVIGYLLTILMFLTPIFYPETKLPPFAASVMKFNPIFVLVHSYRAALLDGHAPDWISLGWFTLAAAAIFVLGHAWFYKLRKSFADLI